jgi:Fe-S-cluster containining protein
MSTPESKQPIVCRRCGVCCTWHQAFLTPEDTDRITKHLGITEAEWDELYDDPRWRYSEWRLIKHVDGACAFLKWEGGLSACAIHSVKPECCAKWQSGLDKKECREKMGKEESKP